jgi:hypothetical protein
MDYRRTRFLLVLLLLGAGLVASPMGCTGAPIILYNCHSPIVGRLDHFGMEDACCEVDPCPCSCIDSKQYRCDDTTGYVPSNIRDCKVDDAGTDASASCGGTCAPIAPLGGWEGPVLFWSGPSGTAPICPKQAPVIGYQGHDGIVATSLCDACSCAPSTGHCEPPASITASSEACDKVGVTIPFDGPVGWDGSCTAHDCIGPAPQCTHALSVVSLAVGPLIVTEEACAASPTISTPNTPTWTSEILACRGVVTSGLECGDPGTTCVPSAVRPDFQVCIYHDGETPCPAAYPQQHFAYSGYDDTRDCTPCGCDTPAGGSCEGTLTLFTDAACATPASDPPIKLSSLTDVCASPSLPLGSKTVTLSPYEAGTCVAGGGPSGSVSTTGPSTFCCLA